MASRLASWVSSLHPRGFGGRFTRGAGHTQRQTRVTRRAIKRANKQTARSLRGARSLGEVDGTRVVSVTRANRPLQQATQRAAKAAKKAARAQQRQERPGALRRALMRRRAERADFARGYGQTAEERQIAANIERARAIREAAGQRQTLAAKAAKAAARAQKKAQPRKVAKKAVPRKATKAAPVIRLRGGRAV